jgi:gliding motility-associated protein GldL
MNIGDFLHSKRWKLMQNYIYSWGASVVLIGALFKLEHLPGASVFLGVGLSIEAIIFFVSAFEPMMEMPDWKVVYPQLRTGDENERDRKKYQKHDDLHGTPMAIRSGGQPVAGTSIPGPTVTTTGISDNQLAALKESFEKLSQTANGLRDITNAVSATDNFVKNLNSASESVSQVASANQKVSSVMNESATDISSAFKNTAQQMKESSVKVAASFDKTVSDLGSVYSSTANEIKSSSLKASESMQKATEEMAVSYKSMTTSLGNGYKGLEKNADKYVSNLDKLNKNLTAINSAYELHLKGAAKVDEMVTSYTKGVGEIGNLLNTSIEETKKFNQNTKDINNNIQELNNIYGRMLGALNGKK